MLQIIHQRVADLKSQSPADSYRIPVVLLLLASSLVAAILALVIFIVVPIFSEVRLAFLLSTVCTIAVIFLCFFLVFQSRIQVAVSIIVITHLLSLLWGLDIFGLVNGSVFLVGFSIPVLFAAMAGSRKMVISVTIASVLIVAYILFRSSAFTDSPVNYISSILVFSIATGVVACSADYFSRSLQSHLSNALQREHELEELRQWLEQKVQERTVDLKRALYDVELREATIARALTDLSESESLQRAILDAIPDAMFRASREGICLDFKPAHLSTDLKLHSPITGMPIAQVLPFEYAYRVHGLIAVVLDTGEPQLFESTIRRGAQVADYEIRMVACADDEVLGIIRDVTEQKKADRIKSEFVSVVSHELRTPLTSIRGSIGLVAGEVAGPIPPKAKEMLEIAQKNSMRLLLLINDILDIEKIETGKMRLDLQPRPLLPMVEHAVAADQNYSAQYNVAVRIASPTPDVVVRVDADRMQQVLANLLSNAVKFSPSGGEVRIAITACNDRVRVAVQDQGPGIAEEFRARIFQKFAQADASDQRQKGGAGLGLNISKAIIEQFGGLIGFESEPGQGSTFFFELPVMRG